MKLAIATMIRNESRNYLPALLNAWAEFADELIVLDNSDLNDYSQHNLIDGVDVGIWEKELIYALNANPAWGNESPFRQQLFELVCGSNADWIIFLDADMIPLRDPKPLMQNSAVDAVAFPLYDLWQFDPLMYREDRYWQAHNNARIWAIRKPSADFTAMWNPSGLHCGHLPQNLNLIRVLTAPKKYALLHYAYASVPDRMFKHQAYMHQAEILGPMQLAHAESITDENPELFPLPFKPRWEISK